MGRPKELACMCQQNLQENFPILTDELVAVTGWGGVHCKLADKLLELLLTVACLWCSGLFFPRYSAYLVSSG